MEAERKMAIPLCLPNNCTWDSETGQCVQTKEKRRSLYVVEEALEQLRKIEGPVCVVCIVGPSRSGKSYVLSEMFSQSDVFPLGHLFTPVTMGIWLWIVPQVFKDSTGQEFNVVLLDSEGTDSVTCEGYDDSQIFTLTVLLASVLIYNSQDVPKRTHLDELNYIAKLSQRIEVLSKTTAEAGKSQEDSEFFSKTFPFFIWLLRDVIKDLPTDFNIKDYFLKKVFKVPDSSSAENQDRQKVADSILGYFSGFEAFVLPPPTADKELMKNIKDNKSQMDSFFQKLNQFKRSLRSILTPKKGFNEGELVTGEGLAALVQSYVEAINSPGTIPNIQNTWETFVKRKCSEAITEAEKKYEEVMESNLKEERPCENDELSKFHVTALDKGINYFMKETVGISTKYKEKHLNELKKLLSERLIPWKTRNKRLIREQEQEKQRLKDTKSSRPLCEIHVAPPTLQVNLRGPFSGFTDGSKDEEAKARAAPNGSASGGVQNTHPTISSGNNPGTASVPSFGWVPLQQMFGGNSSQPLGMGSFQAGSLGRFDGLFSELLDEDYITRRVDNSLRRFKRETRMMSESPFPDLLDPFGKLFK